MTTFTTSRTIPATPDQVFAAISDPLRHARWWGPKDFSNVFDVREFRTDGKWQFTMYGPGGKHFRNESRFHVVEPPHKVVIEHVSEPKYRLTIALAPHVNGTLVSWEQVFENAEVARRIEHIVVPANEENLDRLTAEVGRYPHGVPERITVETRVAAPVEAVWQAYTTPADITQWNAASSDWHTTRASVDLRVGGAFSSRMEAKDGSFGFDFAGTYTAIVPHRLIEYAFGDRHARVEFHTLPDGVSVRVSFDAESTHPIAQQRDGWQAILESFARHCAQAR